MKKTLYLAMVFGLISAGALAAEEQQWNETTWDTANKIKHNYFNKNDKLIIALGTDGNEVDLGGISLWNGVIKTITEINPETNEKKTYAAFSGLKPDDENASPLTYTYGALELVEDATVKLSKQGSADESTKYTTVGTLTLKNGAQLTVDERTLTVTGLPYVELGSGASIILSALDKNEKNSTGGVLSIGASYQQSLWDSIVVKGINGGEGTISNSSDQVATIGGENAKNIEYNNVNITINGSQENTEIVAKLGNAGIFNETQGKEVVISGGKADGAAVAVSQISTGKTANQGGDVTLLNREGDKLMMDSLYIGTNKTVTIKQGSDKEDLDASSTIQMNAYNINDIKDMSLNYCYGVLTEKGAALNADLILGAGSSTEAVMFATETEHLEYGTTTDEHGYGLNMMDNDLTLTEGIVMYYDYTYNPEGPMEMLLFTNVDSLTLGAIEYDNKYFDFREGIAASTFFSTEQKNTPFCDSFSAPTVDEEGNKKGWFIEYRDDGKGKGTGDVYLAYNTIKAANVPEPTTATLSLLALAGLAARRRRR